MHACHGGAAAGEGGRSAERDASQRPAAGGGRNGQRPERALDILLCDDHQLFLEGLGVVFRSEGHQVHQTARPEEALWVASAARFDVCVMDLHFRQPSGGAGPTTSLDAIVELMDRMPVLVLTGDAGAPSHLLLAGQGVAVVSKSVSLDSLLRAVEATSAGRSVPAAPLRHSPTDRRLEGVLLTHREREVLEGLVRGWSTTRLAAELGVRPSTARTHVQTLLDKLGVHSRLEAVTVAVRHRLVELVDVG